MILVEQPVWTSSGLAEYESDAADIVNHWRLAGTVNLVAQAVHMHVDQVRRGNEAVVPNVLEQHRRAEQLIAPPHRIKLKAFPC